jgi:hypothetical protein
LAPTDFPHSVLESHGANSVEICHSFIHSVLVYRSPSNLLVNFGIWQTSPGVVSSEVIKCVTLRKLLKCASLSLFYYKTGIISAPSGSHSIFWPCTKSIWKTCLKKNPYLCTFSKFWGRAHITLFVTNLPGTHIIFWVVCYRDGTVFSL